MNILFGIIVIIISILNICFPESMWELTEGFRYRNVELSDAGITLRRLGGVVGVIMGIMLFYAS